MSSGWHERQLEFALHLSYGESLECGLEGLETEGLVWNCGSVKPSVTPCLVCQFQRAKASWGMAAADMDDTEECGQPFGQRRGGISME